MTRPIMPDDGAPRTRPVVDARQLWAGGIVTAVVAALVALVGVVVCRWLFNIPLLSPSEPGRVRRRAHHGRGAAGRRGGAAGDRAAAPAAGRHAAAAVVLRLDRRPGHAAHGAVPVQHVRADVAEDRHRRGDLVIGFAIGSLLNGVGARAIRQRQVPPRDDYDLQGPYNQGGNQGGTQGGYDQGTGRSQNQWGPSSGRSRGPGG